MDKTKQDLIEEYLNTVQFLVKSITLYGMDEDRRELQKFVVEMISKILVNNSYIDTL